MKTKDLLFKDFENYEMHALIKVNGGQNPIPEEEFSGAVDCDGYTNDGCTSGDDGCCDTDAPAPLDIQEPCD